MKHRKGNHVIVLKQIEQAFASYRRQKQGKRHSYPTELRAIALSGRKSGVSDGKIAIAAGISQQSLANWRSAGADQQVVPRELQLRGDSIPHPSGADSVVEIYFRSGIRMNFPVSELSSEFLLRLNGGGQ